jgi:hypothetical protein
MPYEHSSVLMVNSSPNMNVSRSISLSTLLIEVWIWLHNMLIVEYKFLASHTGFSRPTFLMYRNNIVKCKHLQQGLATRADQTLWFTLHWDRAEFIYLLIFCSLFMQEFNKNVGSSNIMRYKISSHNCLYSFTYFGWL